MKTSLKQTFLEKILYKPGTIKFETILCGIT